MLEDKVTIVVVSGQTSRQYIENGRAIAAIVPPPAKEFEALKHLSAIT